MERDTDSPAGSPTWAGHAAGFCVEPGGADRVMDWCMPRRRLQDPAFPLRRRLPGADRRARRRQPPGEYFDGWTHPRPWTWASTSPTAYLSGPGSARRRRNISAWPSSSSSAPTPARPSPAWSACGRTGSATTVDLLGEKTVIASEADRYAARSGELLVALTTPRPLGTRRPPRPTTWGRCPASTLA